MHRYRLHSYFRSSASYRVRICLALKGLGYDYVPVHLVADGGQQHAPSYRSLNPMREVPTLEVLNDAGDPVVGLAQSVAIVEYLDEVHPDPPLYGDSPLQRALIRQRVEGVNAGIQPVQNLRVMQRLDELFDIGRPGMAEWASHWIVRGFEGLEQLTAKTAGVYSVGDRVSAADVWLVPQVYNARRFSVDMTLFPTLKRVAETCEQLSPFVAAHPSNQADTPEEFGG